MTTILLSPADAKTELAGIATARGVRVIAWPELRVDRPENYFAFDEAIENLFGYDWLILKNERAAGFFLRRFELSHQPADLDELKILAVGDGANQALAESQVHVDILVDRFPAANVFAALASYAGSLGGLNVLIPTANLGHEPFEEQLADAGARSDNVTAYRTVADNQQFAQMMALLVGGGIDAILFTGPQSVTEFACVVDTHDLPRILKGITVVCSDEETSAAAAAFGLNEPFVVGHSLGDLMNRLGMFQQGD